MPSFLLFPELLGFVSSKHLRCHVFSKYATQFKRIGLSSKHRACVSLGSKTMEQNNLIGGKKTVSSHVRTTSSKLKFFKKTLERQQNWLIVMIPSSFRIPSPFQKKKKKDAQILLGYSSNATAILEPFWLLRAGNLLGVPCHLILQS